MSWKRIKTFLIILFLIINLYLFFSNDNIRLKSETEFDNEYLSKTVQLINKNFNIEINDDIFPSEIENLKMIDVDNIMFSQTFKKNIKYTESGSGFCIQYSTNTVSYSENNARTEMESFLSKMGIDNDSYKLSFENSDDGLVCIADEYINGYPLFSGKIKAVFSSKKIDITGQWYINKSDSLKEADTSVKMADISGVLIDASSLAASDSSLSAKSFTDFSYGLYVASYDENVISKTATAVPCYMIVTDVGSIYYYDAVNGILLKQED